MDELRFDVSVNDCNWYLRAKCIEDKVRWVDALEQHRNAITQQQLQQLQQQQQQQQYGLKRHGSVHSLSSNTFSNNSSRPGGGGNSASKTGRGLSEKLAEMETFRDILCRQIDTLQSYFDSCSDVASSVEAGGDGGPLQVAAEEEEDGNDVDRSTTARTRSAHPTVTRDVLLQHGLHSVDFKGEAITFKATTAGIVATLNHCIDLMQQREEAWRRRLDREVQARRALASQVDFVTQSSSVPHPAPQSVDGPKSPSLFPPKTHPQKMAPDFEEGPHSQLGEDEFYDAVEDALDKLEEEQSSIDELKRVRVREEGGLWKIEEATLKHHLWDVIEKVRNHIWAWGQALGRQFLENCLQNEVIFHQIFMPFSGQRMMASMISWLLEMGVPGCCPGPLIYADTS